jgi:two-component system NtrC family sensor kinase
MMPAPVPANEQSRLEALERFEILDTEAEAEFDDFTRLAARICGTPVAQITFVDRDRQWFKSNFGTDVNQLPREIGFCAHTILNSTVMEVPDMLHDDRFRDNPLVAQAPSVRFYAGAPLVTGDGAALGSLCVLDVEPKSLTDDQRDALEALSRQVVRQLELRSAVKRERLVNAQLATTAAQLNEVNDTLASLVEARTIELQASESQLHQAQKVECLGMLAGGIAHDFNNLLMIINGTAELAAARLPVNDPAYRDLEEISSVGRQAASLTRQLLAFSRKAPATTGVVDLNASLKNVGLLASLLGKNVHIDVVPASTPVLVTADSSQLDQILLNLIVNARDAMPNGGTIRIETRCAADGSDLVVTDSGTGMDEQTQSRIFEPFFTTKAPGKGTGLGLSTVASIVRQYGGHISVTSAPLQGTSFLIRLPRPADDVVDHVA